MYWDLSVAEQIQAVSVREMTMGCSKVLLHVEELKRKITYEVLAPATAMLKPFCVEPWPLEKPFKKGLNFLKMSEEINKKKA